MKKSYIADEIIAEYNRQKYWKNKARQKCRETTCNECRYKYICDGKEKNENSNK